MNCFHRFSGSLRLLGLSTFVTLATVSISSADEIIHLGANSPGVVTVSHTGSVYSLRFTGNEVIEYQVDLAQPLVAQGKLRVYEASSDCWPFYDGALGYRDGNGNEHSIGFISGFATLTGQSMTSDSVILDFTDDFTSIGEGIRHRRTTFRLRGKMLSIRVQDMDQSLSYRRNYIGVLPADSQGFHSPQILPLMGAISSPTIHFRNGSKHYYFSDVLDMMSSNASDYGQSQSPAIPSPTTTSLAYNFQTWEMYKPMSDNQSIAAPIDDTFQITISSKLSDTFVTPTHPPSPYRTLLTDRMVLLMGGSNWADYPPFWNQLDQWGMDNIAAYCFFGWSAALPDPPSASNVGPDWWPPVNPSGFTSAMQQGVAKGYLLGAYETFNLMPTSAPAGIFDFTQIARDQNGNPKLSIQLPGIPVTATTASGLHAASDAALLHANAGASMGYLDVQTYGSPTRGADGDHIDQTLGSPWAKTLKQAIADQKTWMRGLQDLFQGPLLGEGSINGYGSNYEYLWAGYCDSTQRVLNTGTGSTQHPASQHTSRQSAFAHRLAGDPRDRLAHFRAAPSESRQWVPRAFLQSAGRPDHGHFGWITDLSDDDARARSLSHLRAHVRQGRIRANERSRKRERLVHVEARVRPRISHDQCASIALYAKPAYAHRVLERRRAQEFPTHLGANQHPRVVP